MLNERIDPNSIVGSGRVTRYLFAALSTSFIGAGLVRFAYTPLLPVLIESRWFDTSATVYLSAANPAGALFGAVTSTWLARRCSKVFILRGMNVLATLSLLACAFPISLEWYFSWRFLSGVATGATIVLVAATFLPHVRSQLTRSMNTHSNASGRLSIANRIAPLLLRLALGATLLSAVADRFGIWGPPGAATVSWGDWTHFVAYTAKVNSFLPSALAPALAIIATAAEALLGITLILGIFRRPVAFASAALFALFAGAMIVSFGVKAPLNYSVFVDFAAAFLLGAWPASPKLKSNDVQQ